MIDKCFWQAFGHCYHNGIVATCQAQAVVAGEGRKRGVAKTDGCINQSSFLHMFRLCTSTPPNQSQKGTQIPKVQKIMNDACAVIFVVPPFINYIQCPLGKSYTCRCNPLNCIQDSSKKMFNLSKRSNSDGGYIDVLKKMKKKEGKQIIFLALPEQQKKACFPADLGLKPWLVVVAIAYMCWLYSFCQSCREKEEGLEPQDMSRKCMIYWERKRLYRFGFTL